MIELNNLPKKSTIINRPPVKLLRKKSYPTYQLHATINNNIDPSTALKIAILETMSWLRKRFRELDIPDEIKYPEPEGYMDVNLEDFKSFRLDDGYIVDVVYIKETEKGKGDSIWSFSLSEPDLGPEPGNENQKRKPIPGRTFQTNIGFRIYNGTLQCGFKTICSEPEGTNEPCEVFRTAVVKEIVRNKLLGLRQVLPIIEEAHSLENIEMIKRIKSYIINKNRQLPFVIFVEHKPKINIANIEKELLNPSLTYGPKVPFELIKNEKEYTENSWKNCLEFNNLVKYKMSFAQFGILPLNKIKDFNKILGPDYEVSEGDIMIIHPLQFEKNIKTYNYHNYSNNKERFFKKLDHELQEYPKGKTIEFGNTKFLNEARIEEQQQIINMSNSKEAIVLASNLQLRAIKEQFSDEINNLSKELEIRNEKIARLEDDIISLKLDKKSWQATINDLEESHEKEKEKLEEIIKRLVHKLERPNKTEDIPEWVEKHFNNRLIFHQRAKDLITKVPTSEVDMELLCDAIEFLAHEYRDETLGLINREERNKLCKKKYNRPFDVGSSGDVSVRMYPKEYKIKYGTGYKGKLVEMPLDMHLKVGKGNENILRIYFLFDNDKKLIVVGSLPYHLKTS